MAAINLPGGMTMAELKRDLRCYLRDFKDLNRLLEAQDGLEHTEDQLDLAIRMALSDWETTPPIPAMPPPYKLLIMGSAIEAIDSVIMFYTRNQFAYNDGGIQVPIEDKAPGFTNVVERLKRDYETKKIQYKMYINATGAYGSIESEYSYVSRNNY